MTSFVVATWRRPSSWRRGDVRRRDNGRHVTNLPCHDHKLDLLFVLSPSECPKPLRAFETNLRSRLLLYKKDTDRHVTRANTHSQQIYVFNVDTKIGKKYERSPYYIGTLLWNKLSKNIQGSENVYAQAAFPNGPQSGPTGAQLGPIGAQPGPTWNAAWVCLKNMLRDCISVIMKVHIKSWNIIVL